MWTYPETELIGAALKRLEEETGLQATQENQAAQRDLENRKRPDGRIRIEEGHREWFFDVECKRGVDRLALLRGVKDQIREYEEEGLLIVPYMTPELARHCQEMGLPFIDAAGNAFLKKEGLFVLVTGRKPEKAYWRTEKPMRAFDRTGLRVVFVLLTDPELMQAPYRELAQAAGVALGTVGWILTDLREHGFLMDGKDQRRWIDRDRAIQTWVTNYPLRLRERLGNRRFAAKEMDWWKDADPHTYGGCWGGEVAATKLNGDLVPKTVTLYMPKDRNEFLAKYRLRADPNGNIEVMEKFWDLQGPKNIPRGIAPYLLIYADLMTIGDPRTLEEARRIREHYLA